MNFQLRDQRTTTTMSIFMNKFMCIIDMQYIIFKDFTPRALGLLLLSLATFKVSTANELVWKPLQTPRAPWWPAGRVLASDHDSELHIPRPCKNLPFM